MKIKIIEQDLDHYNYKILLDTDYYNDIPIGDIYKITNDRIADKDNMKTIYFVNLCSKIQIQSFSDAKEFSNDMIDFLITNILDCGERPLSSKKAYWFGNTGFVAGLPVFKLEQIAPMNYFYELTMSLGYRETDSFDKCEEIVNKLLNEFRNNLEFKLK